MSDPFETVERKQAAESIAEKLDVLIAVASKAGAAARQDGAATPEQMLALRTAEESLLHALTAGPLSPDEVDRYLFCPRLSQEGVSDAAFASVSNVFETARRRLKRFSSWLLVFM